VLVAQTAAPRYAEIMGRLSGLITEVGSATCHLASVAREFGVPMAVNLSSKFGYHLATLDTIGANYSFPLAISKSGEEGDGLLTLKVKPINGCIDQAGGLAFGLRDIGNYFVFRINALEDNAILFEFVNNRRIERARFDLPIGQNQWHALEVVIQGNKASCRVDGIFGFDYLAERPLHGHVGLWTKADSTTLFAR
jgi:pyruvate,water dikinase